MGKFYGVPFSQGSCMREPGLDSFKITPHFHYFCNTDNAFTHIKIVFLCTKHISYKRSISLTYNEKESA